MEYKMIFSDMDGTLLKNDNEISEANRLAVKQAVAQGVHFVICTGRGVFGVERFLEQLNLLGRKGHVICQNGGAVYHLQDMSLAFRQSFQPSSFAFAVKEARKLNLELYYYDDRRFITEAVTDRVRKYCKVMGTQMHIMEEPLEYDGEFTKCLITGPKASLLYLQNEIRKYAGEELDTFFSSDIFMEVVKKGVSKGNSMAETAKQAGVTLDAVIAVGDSDNDLSMIQRAGLGIAVANGEEKVKQAADYVTQNTCEQDAIAEIIQKFILK